MTSIDTTTVVGKIVVDVTKGSSIMLTPSVIGSYHIHIGYFVESTGELIYNVEPIVIEVIE
ncbi:MAG: hypothetical protein GKR91_09355 [Pseudomonadales bacterium]|nr:hypothetical protein [Pseudomonadales bacterium]